MDNRDAGTLAQGWNAGAPWPAASRRRLGCGALLQTVELPHLRAAAITVHVGVGSRFEDATTSGLSHLLEHVLFRGCEGLEDAAQLNAALEDAAVSVSAGTARDSTSFEASCRPEDVPRVLTLLGAMLTRPVFRDLAVEREIVLEELQDEVDAKGRDVDPDNLTKRALFGGQGLGRTIGGDRARVAAYDEAALEAWFARHYVGRNAVITVAGPVTPAAVWSAADAAFTAWPQGERRQPPPAELRADLPAFEWVADTGSQASLQLSWPLPPEEHDDWPALFFAHRLLDDGTVARLPRRLVDEDGLAYHVGASLEMYADVGLLTVDVAVRSSKAVAVVDAVLEVVASLSDTVADPHEWRRVRRRASFDLATAVDHAAGLGSWLGLGELLAPGQDPARRACRLERVHPEHVRRVATRWLAPDRLQLAAVGELSPMARASLRRRVHRGRVPR